MVEKPADSKRGWAGRVAFSGGHDGFAFRPGEVLVAGERALDVVGRRYPLTFGDPEPLLRDEDETGPVFFRLRGDVDPLDVAEELRTEGVIAQPNHVLFAHGDCGCCPPHPAARCGPQLAGSPVYASPVYASPVYASPVYASPVYASPVYASELQATGRRKSSAKPAPEPTQPRPAYGTVRTPRVAILDTGIAGSAQGGLTPDLLASVTASPSTWEQPDEDGDTYLDPAAGHGTFIAGLIEQLAPGCDLTVELVLTTYGDGDEFAIAQCITTLDPSIDLLNLSFGGYAMEEMFALATAIRRVRANGTVVVASAGNDASCRPAFPAAFRGVIGVAALGPHGPAPFTNYGPWVRACAPGVDLVSSFFRSFEGPDTGAPDPD
ncbi:MAG: hypothetical protein QOC92_4244, partial [Acidimicrobiaceae bacterium]